MTTTTDFGTWNNHGDSSELTLEATVLMAINGGDSEWRERMETSGALEKIAAEYRAAINEALPEGVSLCGDQFYGPYYDEDRAWDGELDISEIIGGIDLFALVSKYDVDNITLTGDDVTRLLESPAESPALYVETGEDGAVSIAVGPEAHTTDRAVVIRRHDLLDLIGETDQAPHIAAALPSLQQSADRIAFA